MSDQLPPSRFGGGYSSGNPLEPPPLSPPVYGQYVWQPAPMVYGIPAQMPAQPLVMPSRRTGTIAAALALLMALLTPASLLLYLRVGFLPILVASILLIVGAILLLCRKFAGSVVIAVGTGFWALGLVPAVIMMLSRAGRHSPYAFSETHASATEWMVSILILIVSLALAITTLILAFRRSTREWCRFQSRVPVAGHPVYRAY